MPGLFGSEKNRKIDRFNNYPAAKLDAYNELRNSLGPEYDGLWYQFTDWLNEDGWWSDNHATDLWSLWIAFIGGLAISGAGSGAAAAAGTAASGSAASSAVPAAAAAAGSAASSAVSSAASTAAGAVANSGWLSTLLTSISGIGDKLSSWLPGILSQFGSSVLNYENQKKLIDYQNAYNTPSAQMDRLREAGLNPNLMYSQGNTGNQPSSGSIAPVDFDTSQRENRFATMSLQLQAMSTMAQIENIQADTQLKQSERESVSEDTVSKNYQNSVFVEQYSASLQQTIAITEKSIAEKEATLQSIKESMQRIRESEQNISQSKEYQKLLEAQRKTENELRDARRLQTESQTKLNNFNSKTKVGQYGDEAFNKLSALDFDTDYLTSNPLLNYFDKHNFNKSVRRFSDGSRSVGSNF